MNDETTYTKEKKVWVEKGYIDKKERISTDIIKSFCNVIKNGGTIESACNLTGLDLETVDKWILRGRDESNPEHPYRLFYLNYYEAKIFADANYVGEEQRSKWIAKGYVEPDFPLSMEKIKKIKSYIIVGVHVDTALKKEGIDPDEAKAWMEEAKVKRLPFDHPYRILGTEIASAEAEAELRYLTYLYEQAKQGKQGAAQWMLERRFPKKWTKQDRKELELSGGYEITVNITDDDENKGLDGNNKKSQDGDELKFDT